MLLHSLEVTLYIARNRNQPQVVTAQLQLQHLQLQPNSSEKSMEIPWDGKKVTNLASLKIHMDRKKLKINKSLKPPPRRSTDQHINQTKIAPPPQKKKNGYTHTQTQPNPQTPTHKGEPFAETVILRFWGPRLFGKPSTWLILLNGFQIAPKPFPRARAARFLYKRMNVRGPSVTINDLEQSSCLNKLYVPMFYKHQ